MPLPVAVGCEAEEEKQVVVGGANVLDGLALKRVLEQLLEVVGGRLQGVKSAKKMKALRYCVKNTNYKLGTKRSKIIWQTPLKRH